MSETGKLIIGYERFSKGKEGGLRGAQWVYEKCQRRSLGAGREGGRRVTRAHVYNS